MNNMQQLMKMAQVAQKKHEEFKKKVFDFSEQDGLIKISVSGTYKIDLDINFKNLLEFLENDYESLNDIVQVSINNAVTSVKKEESKIISAKAF